MRPGEAQTLPLVDCAVSGVTAERESESGDLSLVVETDRGILAVVVDGAGHGAEAAIAARLAVATLEACRNLGVIPLVLRCHQELKRTRGAVMTLASFDAKENTLTMLGVGNVEGVLLPGVPAPGRGVESILLCPGIVGYRLPPLRATVVPVAPGDLLILATDGIRNDFSRGFSLEDRPSQISAYVASNFQRGGDDALVLVLRYMGSRP